MAEGGSGSEDEFVSLNEAPLEAVFAQLRSSRRGLAEEDAAQRIELYGYNRLEEKKESKILKFLGFMWNPLSWVMEAAAVMSLVLAEPPDYADFLGISFLLIANATISFIEENAAGNAAAALMERLAPTARVLRDGKYKERDAAVLVPGDIITIKLGDIIPADARLLEGDPLKIDQSALTGESMLSTKYPGDEVYSGSVCKQGELEALVIATGIKTFFGRAANLVETTEDIGHFQQVLTSIGAFCICSIAVGLVIETSLMFTVLNRSYQAGINNLLVLLIGGIPIAMPTVLSVTMAIGSNALATQGAIVKRITAIEELAGMDILCSDKTGTLTLNKLTVDKNLVEVIARGMDADEVILLAARASRVDNPDAIDACIVGMLDDPEQARAGIKEVHFFPFNPVDKRTAITYTTEDGKMYRASKGAPEQILALAANREHLESRVRETIRNYADHGLRSLGVCLQEVPDGNKDSPGGPWEMAGLLPLYDPPRHDSAETIRQALELGVKVKMITGDQLAIAIETGRRLGMGSEMYPSTNLFSGKQKDPDRTLAEIIEDADGFAGVFPEHKYAIVAQLQTAGHIVGMTGDGVNDAPALKKANIGIAVDDATDAARGAADIALTEPGLSVIIHAVLTARCIFQRMKNYTIYATSITIRIVLGFMVLTLVYKYDFSPFMTLVIAILNDGTILSISTDNVKPSPHPDSWRLKEIFVTGIGFGIYLALTSILFFYLERSTTFFQDVFGVQDLAEYRMELTAIVYLQVSISSQALIFVTRSQGFSYFERPGTLLIVAFITAQLIATLITVYADFSTFAQLQHVGWGWAGVVWLYSLIIYVPLDFLKFGMRYLIDGGNDTYQNGNRSSSSSSRGGGGRSRSPSLGTGTSGS